MKLKNIPTVKRFVSSASIFVVVGNINRNAHRRYKPFLVYTGIIMKLKPIYILGDKAFITLTQGLFAEIDKEDLPKVCDYNWHAVGYGKKTFYAYTTTYSSGKKISLSMHRLIHKTKDEFVTDHKNLIGIDNRKINLRTATIQQNNFNTGPIMKSSVYKGVHFNKSKHKWVPKIIIDGVQRHIGYFVNETNAALAYDRKAKKLHGEFARLNFPQA